MSKTEERMFFQKWDVKIYSSFGSNKSRGVSILISKFLDYKVVRDEHVWEGRCVYLDIDMADYEFRFINIYAPSKVAERKKNSTRFTSRQILCCPGGGHWHTADLMFY